MGECTQDSIEDRVQIFPQIFSQETQDKITVLLQQLILAPVASVGVGIGEMLGPVNFDGQACIVAE